MPVGSVEPEPTAGPSMPVDSEGDSDDEDVALFASTSPREQDGAQPPPGKTKPTRAPPSRPGGGAEKPGKNAQEPAPAEPHPESDSDEDVALFTSEPDPESTMRRSMELAQSAAGQPSAAPPAAAPNRPAPQRPTCRRPAAPAAGESAPPARPPAPPPRRPKNEDDGNLYVGFTQPGKLRIRWAAKRDDKTPAEVSSDLAYIVEVLPGGLAAAEALIMPGFVLAMINGEPARSMSFEEQMDRLSARPLRLGFCAPCGAARDPLPKPLSSMEVCAETITACVRSYLSSGSSAYDERLYTVLISWREQVGGTHERLMAGTPMTQATATLLLEEARSVMEELKSRLVWMPAVQRAVLCAGE